MIRTSILAYDALQVQTTYLLTYSLTFAIGPLLSTSNLQAPPN